MIKKHELADILLDLRKHSDRVSRNVEAARVIDRLVLRLHKALPGNRLLLRVHVASLEEQLALLKAVVADRQSRLTTRQRNSLNDLCAFLERLLWTCHRHADRISRTALPGVWIKPTTRMRRRPAP